MPESARDLTRYPVHLGLGASAVPQPEFTGMAWYGAYIERTREDGNEGRLVSYYDFAESWDSWEKHPSGDELVVCTAGTITLIQELADGTHARTVLGTGQYAVNPAGTWHTADVEGAASVLFITSGMGTEHRPR